MPSKNETFAIVPGHFIKTQWAGPLLMLSASLLFAVMDCSIKVLGSSFRVWDLAFYRFGCSLVILLLCVGWGHNPFSSPNRKLLILRGVFGAAAFLVLVRAFQLIPISTAMVIFYSFPAFAALFGALLFREKITRDLLWVFVTLFGIGIFFDTSLEGGILGQAISLLGAVFAGVAVAIIRKARQTNGSVIIYLYFCTAGAALTFLPFASAPRVPASANDWIMIGMVVGTSLIAQLLMNEGFHYCGSFQGSLLLTSEVFFVALWGFFFLNDPVTWHTWLGGGMILASIIALTRRMAT
jgi:drug/metabolite transporter (DMT)-like permease